MDRAQNAIPVAIIIILTAMLVPLPPIFLDLLISVNIAISVVVLLSSVYVLNPIQFSAFPSILLLTTLFRLSLNIASTRLILMNGGEGFNGAGEVIGAFGQFVVGGNYAVGLIIFIVLIVIQFVVINHGAVRISEVTARFTLDALPGKQLSIDADLNAGIIDQDEARERRKAVSREADFYGSMDGAIRFTQRDAMASMLITLINIIAGLFIGMFQNEMQALDALETFTILTIGDGLVTAIPSLLISIAGGLITTRSAAEGTLGGEVATQLFENTKPVYFSAMIVTGMGLVPGLPTMGFLLVGSMLAIAAFFVSRAAEQAEAEPEPEAPAPEEGTVERATAFLKIDSLAVEIGYGLVALVDAQAGGDFLSRIRSIRKQLAQDLGMIVPPVNVSDNMKLGPREYSILLKGIEVARGELLQDKLMAIDPGNTTGTIGGTPTSEPTFGLPAFWIDKEEKERAQLMNYTVVDASTILATHLTETIRGYAYELMGRQEVKTLIDHVDETHPKLIEELVPSTLSVGEIQKVLQSLLREKVSIRDLVTIFETLADFGGQTKDSVLLTEATRAALSRSITKPLLNEKGELPVISLSPEWESRLKDALVKGDGGAAYLALDSGGFEQLIQGVTDVCQNLTASQWTLLCSSGVRHHLRKLVERFIPQLTIVSPNDIPPNLQIVSIGVVGQ